MNPGSPFFGMSLFLFFFSFFSPAPAVEHDEEVEEAGSADEARLVEVEWRPGFAPRLRTLFEGAGASTRRFVGAGAGASGLESDILGFGNTGC